MDFTVRYEPAPDEVARALFQGLKRQIMRLYYIVGAILGVAGVVCILADAVISGIAVLVAAVVAIPVATWVVRLAARRQVAYLCVPTTLRMTSTGYECQTDQSTTTMQWSLFRQIVTTAEFWLFFANNRQLVAFLPKRAFDAEQQAELADFLSAREQNAQAAS